MALWPQLRKQLFAPRVDDSQVQHALERAREELPTPVIWLLGKAQSGKTSIIRAITGANAAEIGDGFRPCTQTSRSYDFPEDEAPLIRFLDTRGLGEIDYDPRDDLAACRAQSHLLLVVVRAMDHALGPLLEPLEEVRRRHSEWPVIVAQTCLHQGASDPQAAHLEPYPYVDEPSARQIPTALRRSLEAQRESLEPFSDRFVPIDFTLPEDGFANPSYGLPALWDAIEHALPLGLRSMLAESPKLAAPWDAAREQLASRHALAYAVAAGAVAATPLPLVEIPIVLGIHGKMFQSIASIYEQPLTPQRMAEIAGLLGIGYGVRMGGRSLMKLVPAVGSVAAAVYTASTTYALGRSVAYYFSQTQQGKAPAAEAIRQVYQEQLAEGRRRLTPYVRSGAAGA